MQAIFWKQQQLKNTIARTRRKWEDHIKALNQFEKSVTDLENCVLAFDHFLASYKDYCRREANKENRQLKREIEELKRQVSLKEDIDHQGVEIGCTWAVFDFMFRHISGPNVGIRRALDSAIFPGVLAPLLTDSEPHIVAELPKDYILGITDGREMVEMVMGEAEGSLTREDMWEEYATLVQEWVQFSLLPKVFGFQLDEPEVASFGDMHLWYEDEANRDTFFPEIFDVYELYRRHKAAILKELNLPTAEQEVLRILD